LDPVEVNTAINLQVAKMLPFLEQLRSYKLLRRNSGSSQCVISHIILVVTSKKGKNKFRRGYLFKSAT
jgi:hypothetical protein